jgi:hypothetical protein
MENSKIEKILSKDFFQISIKQIPNSQRDFLSRDHSNFRRNVYFSQQESIQEKFNPLSFSMVS